MKTTTIQSGLILLAMTFLLFNDMDAAKDKTKSKAANVKAKVKAKSKAANVKAKVKAKVKATPSPKLKVHKKSRPFYVTDDRLTADVNLERYFILEQDLLANVQALIRDDTFEAGDEETEEEHSRHALDLGPLHRAINNTLSIHHDAEHDLLTFLSHPVNVYHMVRRLKTVWKESLATVLQTKLCREFKVPGMVRHLRYVERHLPNATEIGHVVNFLSTHQATFGPHDEQMTTGQVGDQPASQPLSVDDQYVIAQSLYEQEQYRKALQWLQSISDWLVNADESQRSEVDFELKSVFNMMVTAYNELKDVDSAVTTLERLLDVDPSNKLARDNLAFLKNKAERQRENGDLNKGEVEKPKTSKFDRLCAGKIQMPPSRHTCVYEPTTEHLGWSFHKKETLRQRPPIVLYHDFISDNTADMLKDYSFTTMSDRSWSSDYFRGPRLRLSFDFPSMYPVEVRQKAKMVAQRLTNLPRQHPGSHPFWGHLQVFTSGLQGMHLADYKDKLDLVPLPKTKHAGAFFLFLSEAKQGGQVAMTTRNLLIQPTKGSVLYYHTTNSSPHSYCPAIGGSVWTIELPYYNKRTVQSPWWRKPYYYY